MQFEALFMPLTIKSLRLPNRIVMSPMTRYFSPNGVPGADVAAYYARRVEGGVGLIISEGTTINRPHAGYDPAIPHFHGREALAGWKYVLNRVHEAGGKMAPQLWHVGAMADPARDCTVGGSLESPSGLTAPGKWLGVAMTGSDIANTVRAFALAASDARRLGFDCLELHGAHSYLFDQFFWAPTNVRTDRYGGTTLPERTRFAVEVVRAVRAAVGPDFVISLRLSQWKQQDFSARLAANPVELEQWIGPLADAGVDIFHCSQRRYWEPEFAGSDLNFAGWAKKLTGKHSITVGSVGLSNDLLALYAGEPATPSPLQNLMERLEREEFDLVAVGRALLGDPLWAAKIRDGRLSELQGFSPAVLASLN